jgi:lipopolysaccharide transport system ATP-binding protein
MSQPAIQLDNIGVCYRLYRERVFSLKEAVIGSARKLTSAFRGAEPGKRDYDEFWAVRNATFVVPEGVCLGLTGHNGSGKSTTLKVISGVLHPTEGEYRVRGRISALVELGAGFDPELTGRENIYLGASVSGLSRKEVEKRLDSIVDFAELREFIDIPVKNYSSGMYARLGFAVATDIEPDVLIVDEILAVGDEAFQRKCFDRMQKFKRDGKTILFVSHDSDAIRDFCDEVLKLDHGRIVSREAVVRSPA